MKEKVDKIEEKKLGKTEGKRKASFKKAAVNSDSKSHVGESLPSHMKLMLTNVQRLQAAAKLKLENLCSIHSSFLDSSKPKHCPFASREHSTFDRWMEFCEWATKHDWKDDREEDDTQGI